jgi:hypothetical protein
MELPRSTLGSCKAPFHGIVSDALATPVGHILLSVTFKTMEKYRNEYMQFKIVNFEMAYNEFLEVLL